MLRHRRASVAPRILSVHKKDVEGSAGSYCSIQRQGHPFILRFNTSSIGVLAATLTQV